VKPGIGPMRRRAIRHAMITPRSRIREPRAPSAFSDRLLGKCAGNPPTRAGVFNSSGGYIPRAKINACAENHGTAQSHNVTETQDEADGVEGQAHAGALGDYALGGHKPEIQVLLQTGNVVTKKS
jgi:hypothetical protein